MPKLGSRKKEAHFYLCRPLSGMRQIFALVAVGMPLFFVGFFIANSIASENFPMSIETSFNKLQPIHQTYQAGLNHCENSYENSDAVYKKNEYERCVDLVGTWYAENDKKIIND